MHHKRVIAFYEQTQPAFDLLWMNPDNLAMHYGYWDHKVASHHEAVLRMNAVLAEAALVDHEDVVLDAGCGVGGSSLWLAREQGAYVVGITLLPLQARRAQQAATRRGLAHQVSFDVRDFHQTGYRGGSFTVVWALESVCHSDDKAAFLREAYRLLRPSGRLVMADFFRLLPCSGEEIEEAYQSMLQGWAMPDLFTPNSFHNGALAAGFRTVSVTDITRYVRKSAWRIQQLATHGSAAELPLDEQGPGLAACQSQYQALEAGLWGYVLALATK